MRTIKSQDGKMIVNAERILSFDTRYFDNRKYFVMVNDSWLENSEFRNLAGYTTEKRANRVLDMLNEWLTMQRTYSCFQMPQDREELD